MYVFIYKSAVMICRAKGDKNLGFPICYQSGQVLSVCCDTKYLGHIITDEMADDDDMYRQRRVLYKLTCWLENSLGVQIRLR